jgi:hypothetical protein
VAYAERWVAVDYSERVGPWIVIALLDLLDDHLGRAWDWNLSFESGLECEPLDGRAGFDLRAADGARFRALFMGARPETLRVSRMPDSTRTFQNGRVRDYPGGPCVQAVFAARMNLGIYAIISIGREAPPAVVGGNGLALRIGTRDWERPFGAAIPAEFRLGESGTLCRYPSGRKGPG